MTTTRRICTVLFACCVTAASTGAQQAYHQTRPLDTSNMDRTYPACKNFYQFANGGWVKNNPIPAAYSEWGSFNELADQNTENLRKVLDDAAAHRNTASDPSIRKLGTYYASCMDTAAIEKAGASPIRAELQSINAINTPAEVQRYIIAQASVGRPLLFNFGSTQDAKNSTEVIGGIAQGGIGLPDRDYYFRTDARTSALRAAYVQHVANDLVLAGVPKAQADAEAQRVMAMETALAGSHLTRVQQRDPVLTYNRKSPAEVKALAPGFDWSGYLAAQRVPTLTAIDVQNPKFLTTVDSLLRVAPPSDWRAYFTWVAVRRAAPTLSTPFVNEAFAFSQKLSGAKEQLPRYKKCIAATDNAMGQALGKAYVERYFTPEAKARALQMVGNLKSAFRDRIATRPWMSDSTRTMAYAKLDAFMDKIGYPDKWKDYNALAISPTGSYYANAMAVAAFDNADDNSKIGKPVDRTRWAMSPPTVNAYYNPALNEIVFPAGILQPPFFDPKADDAVNYGGMGAVIGHEMTHGFDDQGAQFDAHGNLKTWFTTADLANFKAKTASYANQFDTHTILDSLHVNGKLTNGENIADLGGLTIAYSALEKALGDRPRTAVDGFTPEQRFFLAWAQIWRNNTTPESARLRIATDPHSPGEWRTNGPLANLPEFAKAWDCKPSDPMSLPTAQQAAIW